MRIVGLTGGIATGKSSVVAMLLARGIPVVDCDKIAFDVVKRVSVRVTESNSLLYELKYGCNTWRLWHFQGAFCLLVANDYFETRHFRLYSR